MLEAYRKHAAAREVQGIPALPLNAEQTSQLCEILKNPPIEEEETLLSLLTERVPPGVDDAAYVKAGFLTALAKKEITFPLITFSEAKSSAKQVIDSWDNAEWFISRLKVPGETNTKDAGVALLPMDSIIPFWLNRMLLSNTVGTEGDFHTRFPFSISFLARSGLVAFTATLGVMPLDMPGSVFVRFTGKLQPGVTLRDIVNAIPSVPMQEEKLIVEKKNKADLNKLNEATAVSDRTNLMNDQKSIQESFCRLTAHQMLIIKLFFQEKKTKDIAELVGSTDYSVRKNISIIYEELNLNNRTREGLMKFLCSYRSYWDKENIDREYIDIPFNKIVNLDELDLENLKKQNVNFRIVVVQQE
ncbi:aconitase B [Xenococcus sp. PCC 7305]|nr:aconitase B [Xenococcus sp. PCC 7305]ELS02706.1 aconitase B [Xenococcus sp. PCC 7305]